MPSLELDPRILGQRISEARKSRGKTQEEVAEFLGYSRPTYIAIEKGERPAKPDAIIKLASFFGRKVNALVRPGEPAAPTEAARRRAELAAASRQELLRELVDACPRCGADCARDDAGARELEPQILR